MIYFYSENNKNAEIISREIEGGLKMVASSCETKQTKNFEEATETDTLIICIAKKTIGSQLPIADKIKAKTLYLAGAGLNLKEIEEITRQLRERGLNVNNSICLRRKALIAGIMEDNLKEEELARAKAFGERIGLQMTGQRAKQWNEKNRIKNYSTSH